MGMTYKRGSVWWIKYYRNGRPMRESSHSSKESDAITLLKLREGNIAHGLPVNPKLNRIRFDEAADDVKTEYAVNGRRPADELERRIRLHLLRYFGGRRLSAIATAGQHSQQCHVVLVRFRLFSDRPCAQLKSPRSSVGHSVARNIPVESAGVRICRLLRLA